MPDTITSAPGPALAAEGMTLGFGRGRSARIVLTVDRLTLPGGARVAVTGPSGAGKSSLLYVLSGIEPPTTGAVRWGGIDIARLGPAARDRWRRRGVGFVFQDFHLVPGLSPLANVLIGATFDHLLVPRPLAERGRALLGRVGAPDTARPVETLSRGEQQRVAIARALLRDPPLIFADEPTASLDPEAGRAVIDLLLATAAERGATLVVVTHDPALIAVLPTVLRLRDGRLEGEVGLSREPGRASRRRPDRAAP